MTNHPGDSGHRYKGMPKTPKPSKCRACKGGLADRRVVRKGGKRYHEECT